MLLLKAIIPNLMLHTKALLVISYTRKTVVTNLQQTCSNAVPTTC
jgi:hypothetical protein